MILNLITLATVKTQLGLSDTTYDASITAMIPIVSNDVRRILNCKFDTFVEAVITDSSTTGYFGQDLVMGQGIYSSKIPLDSYITAYDPDTGIYTFSGTSTGATDYVYLALNIAQWSAVSKMIFYKIGKMSTDAASPESLKSARYGNVAKTFSDSEINKMYDYPQILINDLGRKYAVTG